MQGHHPCFLLSLANPALPRYQVLRHGRAGAYALAPGCVVLVATVAPAHAFAIGAEVRSATAWLRREREHGQEGVSEGIDLGA